MAPMTSVVVSRREASRSGIEPDAHAVLARAEHLRAADAGDARELVPHPQMAKFDRYSMS